MSKSCEQICELFSAYIDGELSKQEAQAVEAHLKECEPCREEYAFFSKIVKCAETLPELSVSDDFRNNLHARLVDAAKAQPKKGYQRSLWKFASGFVAAAAVIALSVVSFSHLPKQSELTPIVPTPIVTQSEKTDNDTTNDLQKTVPTEQPANVKARNKVTQDVHKVQEEKHSAVQSAELTPVEPIQKTETAETITENQPVMAAEEDIAVSGGGAMARTAVPFVKNTMHYVYTEGSVWQAKDILIRFEQAENGYLVPDEELLEICQQLEALEGYTAHNNTTETLLEPTEEELNHFGTHTLIIIEH